MEINKKKVVVIGCGSIGSKYLEILCELGFSVGCYDIKKIDSNLYNNKIIIFESFKNCIESKPDFIIIATPPNEHLSCLEKTIKSNAKILLEKPLAASFNDAKSIIKIAEKNKNRIWCVSNMRYHPGFIALKKNLENLGKIYSTTSHFSHKLSQMRPATKNIFAAKKDEGGVILDCVHDIDLLVRLFGKLSLINSWIASLGNDKIEAEDFAQLQIISEKGVHISINLDFLSRWKSRGIKIVGENATLLWESHGKNPELVSVKILSNDGIIEKILDNITIPNDLVYKEMLLDFTSNCEELQTVSEAFDILSLALEARS